MTRRSVVDAGVAIAVWPLAAPLASALSLEPGDSEVVPGQTANIQTGVLDVNNSPVADYMKFPGLYPTVAGKVATHGPYNKVKDVYSAAASVLKAGMAVAHPSGPPWYSPLWLKSLFTSWLLPFSPPMITSVVPYRKRRVDISLSSTEFSMVRSTPCPKL